jgi:hypothetical protein
VRRLQLFSKQFRKANSQKLVCRMPHGPARRLSYGRPETSRLLKADHYMLRVRIKMRSAQYASARQDTDYKGAGWSGVWAPGSNIEGPACLTYVCIQGDLEAVVFGEARQVLETTFFGYRDV